MNLKDLVAIDVHTHAWKSALAVDDKLTESQEAMGRYFRYQPQHATVPEMADYYRKLKMAFVVFTVDSKLMPRNITNEEIAELAHKHSDVAIPFASINPHRGAEGVRRREKTDRGIQGQRLQVPSVGAGVLPERPPRLSALRGDRRGEAAGAVPHRPDRRRRRHARRRRHPAEVLQPAATSTTSRRTSPTCRSSSRTRRSRGRRRRCRWRRTSRRSTSTSPAGRRSTSRRSWCSTPTRCSRTRSCSAPTTR